MAIASTYPEPEMDGVYNMMWKDIGKLEADDNNYPYNNGAN